MRVPLAMDATLLSDLIAYRKDRDRGVVAASRALLQLYRQRMPELLHKKERGRGADLTAKPEAYGSSRVSEGVSGVELLASYEEKRRARGEERDEAAEWEVGDGSGSDDGASDLGDLDGEGEGEGEGESDDEGEEGLIDGSGDEGEEGEGESEDEIEFDGEAGESDEEEGEDGEEEEEEEEGGSDDEAAPAAAAPAPAPAPAAPRLDVTRLLTPKDFERIRRLKQMQADQAERRHDKKRKRGANAADDLLDAEAAAAVAGGVAIEGQRVDALSLEGIRERQRVSREEKLASTLKGREDRGRFGGHRVKKTGGKSNKEKKKNAPFMMHRKSNAVRQKAKRREGDARKAKRKEKVQFRGKVRR